MGKLSVFIFLIVFAVIASFAFVNTEVTTITVPFGDDYEIPKFALMLVSAFCGMVVMFLYFAIPVTKNFIDNWQYQKKQKRDSRVQEVYSKALNAILAQNDEAATGIPRGHPHGAPGSYRHPSPPGRYRAQPIGWR